MKFNFKKISAITGSILLTGMTMGVAAAANYPNPFVVGGAADVAIVYGTGTGVSTLDIIQAGNVQSNLQSYMSGSGGSTDPIVSGEATALFGGGTKLYINDSLNTVSTVKTKSALPTLLADGTFSGNVDTTITQKIDIGSNPRITFKEQPSSDDDGNYALSLSTTEANYIYNATATFGKAINFSHADSEGESITLFGMDFTISSSTDTDTIVLLKSAETIDLSSVDNPSIEVTVGGATYTIELVSASDTSATIKVTDSSGNSGTKEISEAASKKVNGITIAVTIADETTNELTATVVAGSDKVTLEDGVAVSIGEQDTDVDGTVIDFGTGNPNNLTTLTISVYASESDKDAIKAGESFIDPVYGTFKVDFSGFSIPTDSTTAREEISVTSSGNDKMEIKFTDSRNYEKKFRFAQNTSTAGMQLMGADGMNISIFEREKIRKGEYVIVGNEDQGRLLKLSTVKNSTADVGTGYANSQVKFTDVFSGETYAVNTWASDGVGTISDIGGRTYEVRYWGPRGTSSENYNVSLDYPDSDGNNIAILWPTIKTSKGAKIAFYEPTTINMTDWDNRNNYTGTGCPTYNLSTIKIPDGDGYTDIGVAWSKPALYNGAFNFTVGSQTLCNISLVDLAAGQVGEDSSCMRDIEGLQINITASWYDEGNAMQDYANSTTIFLVQADGIGNILEPAVIIWEEKNDNSVYDAIIIELEDGRTGDDGIGVDTTASGPTWANNSADWRDTRYSNSDITDAADLYGTIVTLNDAGNDQATATINYPDEQVYANLYISSISASITAGSTTTSGTTQLGEVLVKDSEVSSVSTKNLIIIGGSCINSAAANVLGGAYCGAGFTEATGVGSGEFLIKGVSDAYTTGKIALVVAGYDAADTVNAATYLRNQVVDTSKEYKGTSSTTATLVTTEA